MHNIKTKQNKEQFLSPSKKVFTISIEMRISFEFFPPSAKLVTPNGKKKKKGKKNKSVFYLHGKRSQQQ